MDHLNDAFAQITIPTPEAMEAFGGSLSTLLKEGDIIALSGELGAGKSTLARGMIRAALKASGQPDEDIPSPTFTLVQQYPFAAADDPGRSIWHMDLWRLESPDEIHELGFEEAISRHISLIEWPERLGGLLPARALWLGIKQRDDDTRLITLSGASVDGAAAWSERLDGCL